MKFKTKTEIHHMLMTNDLGVATKSRTSCDGIFVRGDKTPRAVARFCERISQRSF